MRALKLSSLLMAGLLAACAGPEVRQGPSTPAAADTAGAPAPGEAYVDFVPQEETWRARRPQPGASLDIDTPDFESATLPNGLTILVSRRADLPLVSMNVALRAGSGAEPADKAGLADLTWELLLEGAGKLDALALADAFADLGTQPFVSTGPDGATVGVRVLKRNSGPALALLADVVQRPRLQKGDFQRRKKEQLANLARMVGSPQYLAMEASTEAIFGAGHPYAHLGSGTPSTVASIGHPDVQRFYRAHAGPKAAALIFTGDITLEEAKALTTRHFGKWRTAAKPQTVPPPAEAGAREEVVLVPKPGLGQTVIVVGRPAVEAGHADEWPLQVANAVFGGFFGARLNMNLREDKAYTYGAFSRLDTRLGVGPLTASSSVRADVTGPALAEFLQEAEGLTSRPISREEMEAARDGIMRSVPGWFETVEGLATAAGNLYLEQQPLDRYARMVEAYEALELETVRAIGMKYFSPGQLRIVLVGDPEVVRTQVGPLELGEIVIRQPAGGDGAPAVSKR